MVRSGGSGADPPVPDHDMQTGVRASPRPGSIVAGKYRVDRVLGRGGMGVVVAAEHTVLKQRVALKFIPEKKSSS